MAVMSESAANAADAVPGEITALVSQLLRTLDALALIGRRMHPPRIKEVVGLLGDQDTALDDAVQRFRDARLPSRLTGIKDQLADAADLALSACLELRKAAMSSGAQGVSFRGLGYYTLAVEALYPLARVIPAVSRWFVSPAQQEDDQLLDALLEPPLGLRARVHDPGHAGAAGHGDARRLRSRTDLPVDVAA
jgi:phospholipase/carboxylesterase